MYKSFKFVLFNKSFPNPAKFQIRPNFGRSRISAGFVKKGRISAGAGAGAELRYSPTFDTVSSYKQLTRLESIQSVQISAVTNHIPSSYL